MLIVIMMKLPITFIWKCNIFRKSESLQNTYIARRTEYQIEIGRHLHVYERGLRSLQ